MGHGVVPGQMDVALVRQWLSSRIFPLEVERSISTQVLIEESPGRDVHCVDRVPVFVLPDPVLVSHVANCKRPERRDVGHESKSVTRFFLLLELAKAIGVC